MQRPCPLYFVAVTLSLLACAPNVRAQQADDNWLMLGWLHGRGLNSRTSVHTDLRSGNPLLGIPPSFDTTGLSTQVHDIDTLVISAAHFFTDRVSMELDAGIPPKVAVNGRGIAAPPGPSAALFKVDIGDPRLNPLATSRQWSPVLALQYHWGNAQTVLRPFAGLGVTYTWFTGTQLNPAFEQAINDNFGVPLALSAGKPGPTSVSASVAPLWAPVLKLGLSYALSEHWGVIPCATYIPYSTTTTNLLKAADGTTLATTQTRIRVDALGLVLVARYGF